MNDDALKFDRLATVKPDGKVEAFGAVTTKQLSKAARIAKAKGAPVVIVQFVDVEGVEWVHFLAG